MLFATAAMGTRFELAIVTDESASVDVDAVGESALREIEDWHRRLTRFEPDSWLCHINRTAAHDPVQLDEETFPLFADAVAVWRDSGGAFDITRGDGSAIAIDHDARTVRFLHDRVSLDMGAIGKGHALDCAAACLRSHGLNRALLQGGTSSGVALGRPPDADAWRVGVATQAGATALDHVMDLIDESFSLSDEASQPDAPFGRHIVDPREAADAASTHAENVGRGFSRAAHVGRGFSRAARRVVVTGPSARLADAWSTALAVLGDVPSTFPAGYRARFLTK